MNYHIALCSPGTDVDVEAGYREHGLDVIRVTLPDVKNFGGSHPLLTPKRSAFPGYMFVSEHANPYVHHVDGVQGFLMSGDQYAKIAADDIMNIQVQVDAIVVRPEDRDIFEQYFSGVREMDFFDTPGVVLFENAANIWRENKRRANPA